MKNILSFTLLIIVLFANYSCTSSNENDLVDDTPAPELVTYIAHIKPVIDNNCLLCHSNPPQNGAPMHLTSYGAVKGAVENLNLIGRISSDDPSFRMPLGGQPLPQQTIDLFIQWEMDEFPEE